MGALYIAAEWMAVLPNLEHTLACCRGKPTAVREPPATDWKPTTA